jgi:hypothetical protein
VLSENGLELVMFLHAFLATALEADVNFHVALLSKKIPSADVNEVTPKEGCSTLSARNPLLLLIQYFWYFVNLITVLADGR